MLLDGIATRLDGDLLVTSQAGSGRLTARGLATTELVFSVSDQGVGVASNDSSLRLNGRDVGTSAATLTAGDRLIAGSSGVELQLIAVND